MSIGAFVQEVGEVLQRGHALFGDRAESGRTAAAAAGSRLSRAGQAMHPGQDGIPSRSGHFAATYGTFATDTGRAIDELASADDGLSRHLADAAIADRAGRLDSGSVVNGAASDTAALRPLFNTPAGERMLIAALRSRVSQQQRIIAAYKARDARMAAVLRAMQYRRAGGLPGLRFGTPSAGGHFGGGGVTLPMRSLTTPAIPGVVGRRSVAEPVSLVGRRQESTDVGTGPAAHAVAAALSRRGSPYVWGAKGPTAFDCSGLTQWSWAQAGVRLGGDTYSQIDEGMPVAPGDVRAGDLIFPSSSFGEDGRSGPGHVQLAISPTEVVHAPQSGDVVRVAPMPSSFVARRPVPGD